MSCSTAAAFGFPQGTLTTITAECFSWFTSSKNSPDHFLLSRWKTNELEIMWAHLIFKHFNLVLFIAPVIIWRNSSPSLKQRFLDTFHSQTALILQPNLSRCVLKLVAFCVASNKLLWSRTSFEWFFIASVDSYLKLGVGGGSRMNNILVRVSAAHHTNLF